MIPIINTFIKIEIDNNWSLPNFSFKDKDKVIEKLTTQLNIKKDKCKNLQALVEQQKKKNNVSINI